jgi:hypothetical protein
MLYRQRALKIALGQVGVRESPAGSNSGAKVRQYQAATSLRSPETGYLKAGRPLVELNRSASVGELLSLARKRGWAHNHTPKPGDIICFDWNTLNGPGRGDWPDHVGIVKRVLPGGVLHCVEGNTAVGNDSNGGSVMVRTDRRISMAEGFIRVPGRERYRFELWIRGKLAAKSRPYTGSGASRFKRFYGSVSDRVSASARRGIRSVIRRRKL